MFKLFAKLDGTSHDGSDGLGGIATLNYPLGAPTRRAQDEGVGQLVSEYTGEVSAYAPDNPSYCPDLLNSTVEVVKNLNQNWQNHEPSPEMGMAPAEADVNTALQYLVKKNKLHKAAGLDGVTNWMLVWGGKAAVAMLTPLFASSWNLGTMPNQWGKALIRYIHKGNPLNKIEISNYRPISLLSTVAKLFTVVWLPRLMKVLAPELVQEQGCAKSGQGSLEHLWAFMATVEQGMEDSPTGEVFAMFADVSKAYDQVWRDGLYLMLYGHGVRGQLWTLIQKWLDGSRAVTEWNGVRGPEVALEQGLRQGCELSPILYCVFVNAFLAKAPDT